MKILQLLVQVIIKLTHNYFGVKTRVEFKGSCLKQDKITYHHWKLVSIYIVYEISRNFKISSHPTLGNCLVGAISLTKKDYIDSINILDMELDLVDMDFFHILVVVPVEIQ